MCFLFGLAIWVPLIATLARARASGLAGVPIQPTGHVPCITCTHTCTCAGIVCVVTCGGIVEETLPLLAETTFKFGLRHQAIFAKSTVLVSRGLHTSDGVMSGTVKARAGQWETCERLACSRRGGGDWM